MFNDNVRVWINVLVCINIKEKAQWVILPEKGYARLEESLSVSWPSEYGVTLQQVFIILKIFERMGYCSKLLSPWTTTMRAWFTLLGINQTLSHSVFHQGCALSLILSIIFMGRVSMCSWGSKGVDFAGLRISSMFYRSCNSVGFIERIPLSSHGSGLKWRV